ncbi:MAG: GGDEF domain-containing protein [bacterium]|nr:GGDEF domain-containing protein [bacterium]
MNRPDDVFLKILDVCLQLDFFAYQIYLGFSKEDKMFDLKKFWKEMSDEEHEHLLYWKALKKHAEDGAIPVLFDNPEQVLSELQEVQEHLNTYMIRIELSEDPIRDSFLLAFRIEFLLINPELLYLFRILPVTGLDTRAPYEQYENHLKKFIDTLYSLVGISPELELLGTTIMKLWNENKKLMSASYEDILTGVLNRRGLCNIINPMINLASRNVYPVAVLMLDLDHFKNLNDTHGHLAGDKTLKSIGSIIKKTIRKSDIVGRWGGEEFLIFLSNVNDRTATKVAELIRKNIEKETAKYIPITVSIGIYTDLVSEDMENPLNLFIKNADSALYESKNNGRNRVTSFKREEA